MVRAIRKHRQGSEASATSPRSRRRGETRGARESESGHLYLNRIVIWGTAVKPLWERHCSSISHRNCVKEIGLRSLHRSYEQRRHHDGIGTGPGFPSAFPRLYVSVRAKPTAVFSCLATGVGRVFTALHPGRVSRFFGCVLRERTLPGGNGAVHLRFNTNDAGTFAVPLVRRRGRCGGGSAGAAHIAWSHCEWRVST